MEQTLKELIEARKEEEHRGIIFIYGDTNEVFVSYKELYYGALHLLYELQEQGFQAGDEVVFQITDNRHFMYSFWACQLGGMVSVPVTTGANDEHKRKLFKVWDTLLSPRMITSSDFLQRIRQFAVEQELHQEYGVMENGTFCLDEIAPSVHKGQVFETSPEDLAVIQFSSGSTGDPKGVMVTHQNVFINVLAAAKWMRMSKEDRCLNWMPLTHDMGLVGTHLKSIILNIDQYQIHTDLFIRRPQLWMKKASEHKATLLYSPNFGYKYFLKYFKNNEELQWDLSSVRMFYNGAEPISLELCREFLDKLAPYGLKSNTMYTVYGLAEGTIAVAFPPLLEGIKRHVLRRDHLAVGDTVAEITEDDKEAVVFADEGYPIENCYARICDESGRKLADDRIGYIHIRGGSVTKGYYNNPEENARVIDQDGWLNTSDLGFMRDGRLTITGRAKDIIFVNGQNYYSHDIERVAEQCEGIEMGTVVAIGAFDEKGQSDRLILFILFKGKTTHFIKYDERLKKHIYEKMGIRVDDCIPVKKIPKTTSGKVQRYKFREQYANGGYDSILQEMEELISHAWENREIVLPETEAESRLLTIWEEVLGLEGIGIEDDFFSLGGDSLKITQLITRIQEAFQVCAEHKDLFANTTIKRQAAFLDRQDRVRNHKNEVDEINGYTGMDYPLSFSQQRLWFLDYMNGSSPQYNLCRGISFRCPDEDSVLNIEALERGINKIAGRHSILKMSFSEEKGIPVQKYNQDAYIKINYRDLAAFSEEEREKETARIIEEMVRKPFILSEAPLIRAYMLKKSSIEYVLVLSTHHIIFDGWSFGIFLKELMEEYNSAGESTANMHNDRKRLQYVDYAGWQTGMLGKDKYQKQMDFWKGQLASGCDPLDLPLDKPRPAMQSYEGDSFTATISKDIAGKVKGYAQKTGTTPFMVLLGAFQFLLYRYGGDKGFAVGTSAANRNRRETEDMIGFFTNNLVLCTGISEGLTFDDLIRETRKTTLEAYENQDIPFDKLVEELHVPRDTSMNPLFQVMFTMQNTQNPKLVFGDAEGSVFTVENGYARFDLAVDVHEAGKEISLVFEYNTGLFKKETVSRMAANYIRTLSNVLSAPYTLLDEVDILAEEESCRVLSAHEHTVRQFPEIPGWILLFEKQAEENAGKTAVRCGEDEITYGELNQKANRLGRLLQEKGIGADSVVGICLDRSIELVAAILGIHKAGGAYLPMDPIFPVSRLSYMIEDAGVKYIISQKDMIASLPDSGAEIIYIDFVWEENEVIPNPDFAGTAGDLAYILYTSGSTGNPKGVEIEQGSLINFLRSMEETIQINADDRWLAITTISFDISILELLLPLMTGAAIVMAKREDVFDGSRLLDLLKKEDITIMQATPATWKLMLDAGFDPKEDLQILCGGEALPRSLADRLVNKGSRLLNLYGPTETTIWSAVKVFQNKVDRITIGKPIANTSVYVLDKHLMPVPLQVPGELYIGGAGLARGYRNLEKLTKEKFIRNPFAQNERKVLGEGFSKRLYKTGDLVKFLENGELEYLERMDNQVKVRGFRIELEEIQTILSQHPSVKECVTAVKEVRQEEKIIAAYMILREGRAQTDIRPDEFRAFCKEKLPDYMIPSAFIVMDEFPLTLNNKVDKKALPNPAVYKLISAADEQETANGMEKMIAEIWKEVLGLPHVGTGDNFFDLGGYSLLLAQVRSKISERINRDISIIDLFKYPTVRSLAGYLSGGGEDAPEDTEMDKKGIKGLSRDIAVIGVSGRFPGAKDVGQFWENLCRGQESVTRFEKQEAVDNGADPEEVDKPEYVRAWGTLDDIDRFDARFFGYNPKEATVLDPQQRIFLEEVWKVFEYAGYDPENCGKTVGVYAGVGMNTYIDRLREAGYLGSLANDYQIMTGNDKDFLSTRVSYKLNLSGPSMTIQTACSSSLVAVHQACNALLEQSCDMAVAGGVSIRMPQRKGYLYQEGMILSKDGHCRAFDKEAGGCVGGNGAGVVLLKRYEDAAADRDEILAVIKGSAINNDGAEKIGYTAPSVRGQAKAIKSALKKAGVDSGQICFVEAHGTGTSLGDPIEIEALTQAYHTNEKQYCAIGSVKTNVGHLDAAAGITGLIKTVLSIKNKKIPPSLHYKESNNEIDFKNSPFYVNTKLQDLDDKKSTIYAGVSSFGIGGTNVHVILQEAPAKEDVSEMAYEMHLFPLSARSSSALYKKCEELKSFLLKEHKTDIVKVAYTLQAGRKEFEYRYCFTAAGLTELQEKLEDFLNKREGMGLEESKELQGKAISDPRSYSLEQLAGLWSKGASVAWDALYDGGKPGRVPLPVYPFEGESYWPKPVRNKEKRIQLKKEFSDFFYTPVWEQSLEPVFAESKAEKDTALILYNTLSPAAEQFISAMEEQTQVFAAGRNDREFKILLEEILPAVAGNLIIVLLPDFSANEEDGFDIETDIRRGEERFLDILAIAQAIGSMGYSKPVFIKAVTRGMQQVLGEKNNSIGLALQMGAIKVIPKEYVNIQCAGIDLDYGQTDMQQLSMASLSRDILSESKETVIAYRGRTRFIQTYKNIGFRQTADESIPVNTGDVYILTGGLGGIGLHIAEEMTQNGKPVLVFLQRNSFPDEKEWEAYTEVHGMQDPVSIKINRIRELKKKGAEILILQADVSQEVQVQAARKQILDRFGKITGIIHTAGSPGGGMIQRKNAETVKEVFRAKVRGTAVLYNTFKDDSLTYMILFSSLNAITGGFGQSDYSSANAYMDAFAGKFDQVNGTRVIAIDWERWPGVGMAKERNTKTEASGHKLLGRPVVRENGKWIFYRSFDPEKDWVLSEHHVFRVPTVAGTTYLEMARAAYEQIMMEEESLKENVYISDVVFMAPMAVPFGKKNHVITILENKDRKYQFTIASRVADEDGEWKEHVRGTIGCSVVSKEEIRESLSDLQKKSYLRSVAAMDFLDEKQNEFIYFGDRWKTLREFSVGEKEAVAQIRLPEKFYADIEDYKIHPALLDVATGALRFINGGSYLPFTYQSILIKKKLEADIFAHFRFKDTITGKPDFLTCNITIYNSMGEVLVEIHNFSMRLVENEHQLTGKEKNKISLQYETLWARLEGELKEGGTTILAEGLTVSEGKVAFRYILNNCHLPQIILSKKDVQEAISQTDYLTELQKAESEGNNQEMHERPELSHAYAEPRNEVEAQIRDIWQPVLAIRGIGIYDEFFELGGDSLLLIQLHTKIKEHFQREFPVVDLYKYNTIALQAKMLTEKKDEDEKPSFVQVNSRADMQMSKMQQRRSELQKRNQMQKNIGGKEWV